MLYENGVETKRVATEEEVRSIAVSADSEMATVWAGTKSGSLFSYDASNDVMTKAPLDLGGCIYQVS